MRVKFATLILGLSLLNSPAQGDIFIDSYVPFFEFVIFDKSRSPYDWRFRNDTFPFISLTDMVSTQCEEIAKQADRVRSFAAQNQRATAEADAATTNNNREKAASALVEAAQAVQSMNAATGYLEVMKFRPIRSAIVIRPADIVARFLIDASISAVNDASWLNSLHPESVQSALPVSVLRPVRTPANLRNNFQLSAAPVTKMTAPDVGSWSASNGGQSDHYPVKLILGWSNCLREMDPFWASYDSCVKKSYTVELDLSQGQFCSSLSANSGIILSFEVVYPSFQFGGQRVFATYRIGQHPIESSAASSARLEGYNKALDYLFHDFLSDVLDNNQQLYRVSDSILSRFDGGSFANGEAIQTRDLQGNTIVVQSRSLRDALNQLNDKLASGPDPVSFAQVSDALKKNDRYRGLQIEMNNGRVEDAVAFKYQANGHVAEIGFMLVSDRQLSSVALNVGFILVDGSVLYYHPNFYRCAPGIFNFSRCW